MTQHTTHEHVIDVRQLSKVYASGANRVHALRGIDLTVAPGEMIAVMGASGAGKSTLMNILGCLDTPTNGSYLLDGVRVDGLSPNELADLRNQKLGFVFQGFNLLSRTAAVDNVELPLLYDRAGRFKDTRAIALAALAQVGLADRADHMPSELSGGQQQRVAIARAIVTDPAFLLADEPTGDLDRESADQILDLLQGLSRDRGRTIVMVTHDPRAAARAGRMLHLEKGRIAREVAA